MEKVSEARLLTCLAGCPEALGMAGRMLDAAVERRRRKDMAEVREEYRVGRR